MHSSLQPPAHALIQESATGSLWMEDGIVVSTNNKTDVHTLAEAKEKVLLIRKITGNVRRPLLVDISSVRSISREAREYYASDAGAATITALALLTGSKLSCIIGNFFIGSSKIPVPKKLFTDAAEAKSWLKRFMEPRQEITTDNTMYVQPAPGQPYDQFLAQ